MKRVSGADCFLVLLLFSVYALFGWALPFCGEVLLITFYWL